MTAHAEHSDLIGRVVGGKFRLRRCVGVGSSGAVYEADQVTLGRTVAVKVLKPELTANQRIAERFQDEALLASRLNHPNTVAIIDYGSTSDGLLYMVMEYLRGQTLTQILRTGGPMPVPRALGYVDQVLAGLMEAHAAGVVHADLKADNVMVEVRRDSEQVKVVDFGIAQLVGGSEIDTGDTANKTICGTPEYMAPEVIAGAAPGFASDQYAVGVLLFELLTGGTPFVGGGVMEVLTRHLRDRPPALAERRPDVPAWLIACIERCLAKKPDLRFPTVAELRDSLRSGARVETSAEAAVLCPHCGVSSEAHFKFCPECGSARIVDELDPSLSLDPGPVRATSKSDYTLPSQVLTRQVGVMPLPLVGRGEQSEALFAFLTGSSAENFMQVVGDAGSGKSRLILREAMRAAEVGALVFLAGPDPSGLGAPFYPIRSMLSAVLDLADGGTISELSRAIDFVGLDARDLPGLLDLFGHPTDLAELEAPIRRREVLSATIRVLSRAGERRQGVLVFHNVDAYDRPSRELLARFAEHSEGYAGLRVVVSNSRQLTRLWPGRVDRIDLGPLDDVAIAELEDHLRGHADMPSADDLRDRCLRRPEHIDQLVRFVLEGGVVAASPMTLVDLIAERVSMLPYEAQILAQGAAVFGGEVGRHLLEVAAAEHLDREQFEAALDVLVARGYVTHEGSLVRFVQHLVREVIYDSTPADVRRALHDLAYTALQEEGTPALILGHHADRADLPHSAATLLEQAGDSAVHQLDNDGAAGLYHRALDAARAVLLGSPGEIHEVRYVSIAVKLADTLRLTGQQALARGVLAEARRYAEHAASLSATIDRAEAALFVLEGWTGPAEESLRRGLARAIQAGLPLLMTEIYLDLASLLARTDRLDEADRELTEGVDMLTLGDGPDGQGGPENLWMLVFRLAKVRAARTRWREAAKLGESALARAEKHASIVGAARVRGFLAFVYQHLGDPAREQMHRDRAIADLRVLGDRRGTAEMLRRAARPTTDLGRTSPSMMREAERLAAEVIVGDD